MREMKCLFVGFCLLFAVSCQGSDVITTTAVKTQLAADETVQAVEIEVDTTDGVVTLKGNVDAPEVKERALEIARETDGVKEVVDMIAVRMEGGAGNAPEPERTAGERVDDAAITADVKARLLADPLVKGLDIDVDTRNGVVYLTGTVSTTEQKDRAIVITSELERVLDVQDNLTVQPS